jgi:hypothetical protein
MRKCEKNFKGTRTLSVRLDDVPDHGVVISAEDLGELSLGRSGSLHGVLQEFAVLHGQGGDHALADLLHVAAQLFLQFFPQFLLAKIPLSYSAQKKMLLKIQLKKISSFKTKFCMYFNASKIYPLKWNRSFTPIKTSCGFSLRRSHANFSQTT